MWIKHNTWFAFLWFHNIHENPIKETQNYFYSLSFKSCFLIPLMSSCHYCLLNFFLISFFIFFFNAIFALSKEYMWPRFHVQGILIKWVTTYPTFLCSLPIPSFCAPPIQVLPFFCILCLPFSLPFFVLFAYMQP